jgi:hypothetical protein
LSIATGNSPNPLPAANAAASDRSRPEENGFKKRSFFPFTAVTAVSEHKTSADESQNLIS